MDGSELLAKLRAIPQQEAEPSGSSGSLVAVGLAFAAVTSVAGCLAGYHLKEPNEIEVIVEKEIDEDELPVPLKLHRRRSIGAPPPFARGHVVDDGALAQRIEPCKIKELIPYAKKPGMVTLGPGDPPNELQPLEHLSFRTTDGQQVALGGLHLEAALGYGDGLGHPELVDWLRVHMMSQHRLGSDRHRQPWAVCTTVGSSDAIQKCVRLLVDRPGTDTKGKPTKGPIILVEQYTWSAAIASIKAVGVQIVGVTMDEDGIIADALIEKCKELQAAGWDTVALYTIPTGHNPTGISVPTSRKHDIYGACAVCGLSIIEDDAYYYLQYGKRAGSSAARDAHASSIDALPGLQTLPESYLALDSGPHPRVIRLDTASKTLAPGFRLGWLTAPQPFVDKYRALQELSTQQPSGFSQAVALGMFKAWGETGFLKRITKLQAHYRQRCGVIKNAIDSYLGPDLVEWTAPTAGMFCWIKVKGGNMVNTADPSFMEACFEHKVIVLPGSYFTPTGEPTPYLRLSFSPATDKQIETAVKRIADVLRQIDAGSAMTRPVAVASYE